MNARTALIILVALCVLCGVASAATITITEPPAPITPPRVSVYCHQAGAGGPLADRMSYILDHARHLGIGAVHLDLRPGDDYAGLAEQMARARDLGVWVYANPSIREDDFDADKIVASMARFSAAAGGPSDAWLLINEPWHGDYAAHGVDWRVLYDRLLAGLHRHGIVAPVIGCTHEGLADPAHYGHSIELVDQHRYLNPPGMVRCYVRPSVLLFLSNTQAVSVNALAGNRWEIEATGAEGATLEVWIGCRRIAELAGPGYRHVFVETMMLTGRCTVVAVGDWRDVRVALRPKGTTPTARTTFRWTEGADWIADRLEAHAAKLPELVAAWPEQQFIVGEGGTYYVNAAPCGGSLAAAMLWAGSYAIAADNGVWLVGWQGVLRFVEDTPLWWTFDAIASMRGERVMRAQTNAPGIRCYATDRHALIVNAGAPTTVGINYEQTTPGQHAAVWSLGADDPCAAWTLRDCAVGRAFCPLDAVPCPTGVTLVEFGR